MVSMPDCDRSMQDALGHALRTEITIEHKSRNFSATVFLEFHGRAFDHEKFCCGFGKQFRLVAAADLAVEFSVLQCDSGVGSGRHFVFPNKLLQFFRIDFDDPFLCYAKIRPVVGRGDAVEQFVCKFAAAVPIRKDDRSLAATGVCKEHSLVTGSGTIVTERERVSRSLQLNSEPPTVVLLCQHLLCQ